MATKNELQEKVKVLTERVAELETENAEILEMSSDEIVEKLSEEKTELAIRVAELEGQIEAGDDGEKGEVVPAAAKIDGFVLYTSDPFGLGALRVYLSNGGKTQGQAEVLPFVLPFEDKATGKALDNYILRAGGACDPVRADAAKAAKSSK